MRTPWFIAACLPERALLPGRGDDDVVSAGEIADTPAQSLAGSARARGVEAESQWQIGDGWSAHLGYTRSDSTIRDNPLDPVSEGKQQIGVPRKRLTTGLTYASVAGWRPCAQLRLLSKSYGSKRQHA